MVPLRTVSPTAPMAFPRQSKVDPTSSSIIKGMKINTGRANVAMAQGVVGANGTFESSVTNWGRSVLPKQFASHTVSVLWVGTAIGIM